MTDWQPIETAPKKHGNRVLAFSPYRRNPNQVFIARFHVPGNGKEPGYWIGTENTSQPTHWQPLPSPPSP
jgi:hypothetical protein